MKTVYLIRHARAQERGKRWPDDQLRPLTADGIRRMERAAAGLAATGVELDLILTSPLVRARQTADIVANALPGRQKITEVDWLAPGTSAERLAGGLGPFASRTRIALVGHEPEIGEFAAWLVGAVAPIRFRKGAVACFDVTDFPPEPPADLKWFATARLLALRRTTGR